MRRSKVVITADHVTLALVEKQTAPGETLIATVQIPRAEFARFAAAFIALQPSDSRRIYGDGAGEQPGDLPL